MLAVLRPWHGDQRAFALSQGLDPGQLLFHMHFGMVVFAASGAPTPARIERCSMPAARVAARRSTIAWQWGH